MTPQIGTWIVRIKGPTSLMRQVGKPHYVESVIDDEPITSCGRRLHKRKGTAFIPTDPVGRCSDCKAMGAPTEGPRSRWVPEDDGSTQPVETLP